MEIFEDYLIQRNERIDNAAFDLAKALTGNEDLELDMYYIGEIVDAAKAALDKESDKAELSCLESVVQKAISDFGEDHIDIYYSKENCFVVYHSNTNRFKVGKMFFARDIKMNDAEFIAKQHNIGFCMV